MERPGGIRHPTWDFPRCHLVTAEEKIRELCVRVMAAQNDEATDRILPELRDALHEYCERLRREVAQEMERESRFHKKDDMAAD